MAVSEYGSPKILWWEPDFNHDLSADRSPRVLRTTGPGSSHRCCSSLQSAGWPRAFGSATLRILTKENGPTVRNTDTIAEHIWPWKKNAHCITGISIYNQMLGKSWACKHWKIMEYMYVCVYIYIIYTYYSSVFFVMLLSFVFHFSHSGATCWVCHQFLSSLWIQTATVWEGTTNLHSKLYPKQGMEGTIGYNLRYAIII